MISIVILFVFLAFLGIAVMTKWQNTFVGAAAVTSGLTASIAMLFLLLATVDVRDKINRYEEAKTLYRALDLDRLTELQKAKILQPLIELDAQMRSYKENNKEWWLDLYIPDEVDAVELVRGWHKRERE